jgi:hypothetical protein
MRPQGWYPDPYRNHGERWFSDGKPTNLVRDEGTESRSEPTPQPRPEPRPQLQPEWRWWTVCLPGLLALAVAGSFLFYAAYGSARNCLDGCRHATEGLPVGAAGEVITAIGAVTLLVAGLTTPAWRRACASGLWVAFPLACVCAALIATARPVASVGPAALPSATASLDVAACTAIGGRVVYIPASCFGVPYVADSGQRDFGQVWYGRDGQLSGPANTVGTGATRTECESGKYPDGPTGPVTRPPGHWDAQLSLCMP